MTVLAARVVQVSRASVTAAASVQAGERAGFPDVGDGGKARAMSEGLPKLRR